MITIKIKSGPSFLLMKVVRVSSGESSSSFLLLISTFVSCVYVELYKLMYFYLCFYS